MSDFVTDDQIVDFFGRIKGGFVLSDMPDYIRDFAYREIITRTNREWETTTDIQYLDGRGDRAVYLSELPIISISAITILEKDTTETSLNVDQTDEDRQVWYDENTGKIEIIAPIDGIEWGRDNEYSIFPKGVRNVKVEGQFGTSNYSNILTLLQLYVMLRHLARIDPQTYGVGDKVSEKIGKYSYELYGKSTTDSHRMSLDQVIESIYGLLPENLVYDAV